MAAPPASDRAERREALVFRVTLVLKGLDGLLELLGGVLLLVLKPAQIQGIARLQVDVTETKVAEHGKVTIQEGKVQSSVLQPGLEVDLSKDLAKELEDVNVPQGPDPVVADVDVWERETACVTAR